MSVRKFTPDECDLIKREYLAHALVPEIANKLGRSEGVVRQKILSLGLRRPRLGTRSAPEHLKALAGKIPTNEWRAKYRSWQHEQLRQAQEQKLQARALSGQHLAAKCAEIDAREDLTRNEKMAAKVAAGMTLQAVGDQYGISRERVRQIVKQMPRAAAEATMARALRNPRGAVSRRLQAVMDCLNPAYAKFGGQAKFAADIGIQRATFNMTMGGSPLSKKVAAAIVSRFPVVSRDFLFDGIPGRGDAEFERKLWAWQDSKGDKIFSDDHKPGVAAVSQKAPTTKVKTAVEVDAFARLQETVDAVRRMIEATEPTQRSAQAIKALGVVVTRARELIAELQTRNEADPASKRDP
jgi:hypothetical protein